jgi:hypothetical protein
MSYLSIVDLANSSEHAACCHEVENHDASLDLSSDEGKVREDSKSHAVDPVYKCPFDQEETERVVKLTVEQAILLSCCSVLPGVRSTDSLVVFPSSSRRQKDSESVTLLPGLNTAPVLVQPK